MSQVTVTTEQVHELIEQLAAMTAAASITPEIVANIFEKMRNLNDQEKVKLVAFSEAFIAELDERYSDIKRESTDSEAKEILIEADNGVIIVKVDSTGADFKFLKKNGKNVATEDQIPSVPTLDAIIGENPSNSHTPSTQAVKTYVDRTVENSKSDYPISEEATSSQEEEAVFGKDDGTEPYAKIGSYGMMAKEYLNMRGEPVIPVKDTSIGELPSPTKVPTSQAVADYVNARGGSHVSCSTTLLETSEVIYGNDDETERYVCFGTYGIKAVGYFDMQGNPIGGGSVSVQTIFGKNYLVFG
jgi:hypothetical protein